MEDRLEEILRFAIKRKASDIHFTLKNNTIKIDFRIHDAIVNLKAEKDDYRLIQYLQFKANLDMCNLIKPASGRFELIIDSNVLALRYSVIYSNGLINGVLRILNYNLKLSVNTLSCDIEQNEYFKHLSNRKNGLILICGPTSSGKTTTLYTLLDYLSTKKIFTIEDPIEIYSSKYFQIQVNEAQNLSYDEGIKQLLRHDPDIIMIGEIRDENVANLALRSSLTGHLVLGTIHASSPAGVINRLLDLGVNKMLLEDVLVGIINQRLFMTYKKDERRAIYEICDEKDIRYYFKNQQFTKTYRNLDYYISKAVKEKVIKLE